MYRSPASVVGVSIEDASVLEWLSEFLAPCLEEEKETASRDVDVRLVIDGAAFSALRAAGAEPSAPLVDCFRLDDGLVRLPRWRDDGAELTIFDEALEAFYRRPGCGEPVEVLVAGDSAQARVAVMRVVRELTMSQLVASGWLVVHASAFVVDGRAALVVGPKRAGKTTLLTYALATGTTQCLANDRVAIALDGSRTAWGIATIVSLRIAMMRRFPALERRLRSRRYDFRFSRRRTYTS